MNSDVGPLYNEVIIQGETGGKNPGGEKILTCKHCGQTWKSIYTRIHCHFFGNLPGKKSDVRRCSVSMQNREEYQRVRKMVVDAEEKGVSSSLKTSTISKQQPQKSTTSAIFEKKDLNMNIMRGLCANEISFNVLRNPQFQEMIVAINRGVKGYKASCYDTTKTSLLDECKESLDKELAPVIDTWITHGISIVSDGWSNVKRDPLINIIATNNRGAMFLRAEDFSGIQKIGKVIVDFMLHVIEEVGPSNVLQVVTYYATSCENAGRRVEQVHKHIFWSPCVVHMLNLIFKDLANKLEWFEEICDLGKTIFKFFLNHLHALAMFRSKSKLELLKVAKTRFASHYILLKRLLDCKEALAGIVVLQKWKDWVKGLDGEKKKFGERLAVAILDDDMWDTVHNVVNITKPIYFMIKFCDGECQNMGEVYERMDNMLGEIKEVMSGGIYSIYFPEVEEIVLKRWKR